MHQAPTIARYADAERFLQAAEGWLNAAEAENNLLLGIALGARGRTASSEPPRYWASVQTNGRIVGCACRTPPYRLVLSRLPPASIRALVDDVTAAYGSLLNGVNGPAAEAEAFARAWTARHGGGWKIRFRLRAHELTRATVPSNAPRGELRIALPGDMALLREWLDGYVRDTGIDAPADDLAERTIGHGGAYLWVEADTPRAMVAKGRETATGCAIFGVYTPPSGRRQGYATAAVAALSGLLLESGRRFCCLYTDMANPTSNSIYAKIGYVPLRDDAELTFEP